MNETLRVIRDRRSCRAFKKESVPGDMLTAIVEAGLWAPTGMNRQDRHFTVIQDKSILDRMNKLASAKLPEPMLSRMVDRNNGNPEISIHYFAPALIILSGGEVSCAIAAENICIAAQSLGIGSCIVAMVTVLFDNDDTLARDLKIPDGMTPHIGVALGYAAREMPAPERLSGQITYL